MFSCALCGAQASTTTDVYSPTRIIIKAKPGLISLPMGVYEAGPGKVTFKTRTLSNLHAKYKVQKTRRLFRTVRTKPGTLMLKKGRAANVPDMSNYYIIELPAGSDVRKIADEYRNDPGIEQASPDHIMKADVIPNDPYFRPYQKYDNITNQWALYAISAPQAWDLTQGSSACVVAVVDSGVNYNHEDLAGKVILGPDYVNNDNDPMDDFGHGTHVAGIIGASGNNAKGIAGMCWNCGIMAIKVLNAQDWGWYSNYALGIMYAADHGAKVINLSLGGTDESQLLQDAIDYAYAKGCVVVASAGNNNSSTPVYPAACEHVISVAATNRHDAKTDYSDFGPWVDVCAPGGDIEGDMSLGGSPSQIWSCGLDNSGYALHMGTSVAAPFVSGLAASILSIKPDLTPDEVKDIIKSTADDIGHPELGTGRINAYKALATLPPDPSSMPDISDRVFDKFGNKYVVYCREGMVIKFNNSGQEVRTVDNFGGKPLLFPSGIACSPNGDKVYVSDTYNNRVIIFNSSLTGIGQISGRGVHAIFDHEEQYDVLLWNCGKVAEWDQVLTLNGEGFWLPTGLSVEADGYLYVSDPLKNRILKFDANGNPAKYDAVIDQDKVDASFTLFYRRTSASTKYSNQTAGSI
jgi:thermitase